MSKRLIINLLLGLLFSIGVFVYMREFSFDNVPLREALFLSTSFVGTIAGLFALRNYGFSGPRTVTIILLTAGMGYFFLGDFFFSFYSYALHIDPFPSFADVFYLLAYPFLLLGLRHEVRSNAVRFKKFHRGILLTFVLASLLLAGLVSYFGIYQAYSPDEDLLSNIIAMSYGMGDLILIVLTMLLLALAWEFRGGALSRVWVLFFFSMLANLAADILFATYTAQYTGQMWFYKSIPDMLWMASYLLFASAFFDWGFSLGDAYTKIQQLKKAKK